MAERISLCGDYNKTAGDHLLQHLSFSGRDGGRRGRLRWFEVIFVVKLGQLGMTVFIRADLQVPCFWQRASAPDVPRQDSSSFWRVEPYLLFYLRTLPASPGALVLPRGPRGSLIYGLTCSWKKYPAAQLCFWRAFKFDWPLWRRKYFNCSSRAVRGLSWMRRPSRRLQAGAEALAGSFG